MSLILADLKKEQAELLVLFESYSSFPTLHPLFGQRTPGDLKQEREMIHVLLSATSDNIKAMTVMDYLDWQSNKEVHWCGEYQALRRGKSLSSRAITQLHIWRVNCDS